MPAVLLKFLSPLAPYLAAGIIGLGAMLYVVNLRHDLATADARNTLLQQTNQANAIAIADYKTQQVAWNAALDTLDAHTLASNAATGRIIGKITAAPAGDDGPVAPVLAHALDDLRALQGEAP